ncbi:unnamed protein product, partial [Ectocarpus fasciculatus]
VALSQESVVLVVFDARAQSVPLWLSASGFVLWEGVQLAGAQYRIPYMYKGLIATPDRSRRRDRDPTPSGSGGGVGVGMDFDDGVGASFGGGGVGESKENRPRASSSRHEERPPAAAGLRRRGMSTTDAAILRTRSALSGSGNELGGGGGGRASGRARAWTGGGEESVFNGGGVAGAGAGAGGTYGAGSGSSAMFDRRPGERSRGGLQRISPLWDTGKDGPLSQMPVPFDRVGRTWSRSFNVDAAKTGGPLETSGATLGVSVSALTGQFHRTRVVTLYPRLVVRNFLGFPLEVMPTVMSPKAAAVERLAKCIPPAMPPSCRDASFLRGYRGSPRRFLRSGRADAEGDIGGGDGGGGSGGVGGHPAAATTSAASAAAVGTGHLARTVPNSEAVIIYAFNAADELAKGLAVAAAASGINHSVGGGVGDTGVAGVGGDSDDHRKCVLLRAAAAATAAAAASAATGVGDEDGGVGGFGPALATGLSRPVLADEMGETHLWVVDSNGRRHLAAAFVSLQRATVFVTLSASAQFPPFRVENRSSAETLAYRQVDAHKSMGWHILPPLSWHAFLWQEPDKPRAIQMAFASSLTRSGSDARHSEEYSLDKIGVRDSLEEKSITRSVITRVTTGITVKRLYSEVRVEGRTRVLSFGDVRLSDGHEQGHADSVTRLKRLYNQLDIGVRFSGLSFNIVECSTEGPSEVMSAHVDSVTVAKRSGDNVVELQVFHVQVDDMRRRTRMPVVLQPADSGFNSHLRDAREGGAGGNRGAVPFVRLLWDKEVATLGMPHLKSLDLELQEMRANVDLEFVLHLLALTGSLVPELTSEEVLAKMCRKKAKVTVRHTVPTPAKRDLSMVYVEAFRHSTIVVRVELWVGQAALSPDAAALEDPETTTGGLTVLGGGFLTVLSVLGSSIAHVNPTFVFDELVVTHYCGSAGGLTGLVVTALTQQAVAQGYKVVGSMELLGDPLSLVGKLGDSVVQFFTKTKAEMTGDADTVGAGAKVLVKGLVGGTFGSAAKITGSLEGMIRGLSGTAIAEDESEMEREDDGELQREVKD